MFQSIRRRAALSVLAMVAAGAMPLAARGAKINMILSGFDVTYLGSAAGNTGSIYDAIAHPGGSLNPAEADEVATAVFELDMNHVGTLTSTPGDALSADLKIDGVGTTIDLGTLHAGVGSNGGGFGFDFFTPSGPVLRLGIDTVDVLLTNNVFFFTGEATLLDQDMPFGLIFHPNEPIVFSYTATLPGINGGPAGPATSAIASGAFTVSGTLIPEPATGVMLIAGATFAAGFLRRRPRRRVAEA